MREFKRTRMNQIDKIIQVYAIREELSASERKIEYLIYHSARCKKTADIIKMACLLAVSLAHFAILTSEMIILTFDIEKELYL